jgi:hypothetical protein
MIDAAKFNGPNVYDVFGMHSLGIPVSARPRGVNQDFRTLQHCPRRTVPKASSGLVECCIGRASFMRTPQLSSARSGSLANHRKNAAIYVEELTAHRRCVGWAAAGIR